MAQCAVCGNEAETGAPCPVDGNVVTGETARQAAPQYTAPLPISEEALQGPAPSEGPVTFADFERILDTDKAPTSEAPTEDLDTTPADEPESTSKKAPAPKKRWGK